MQTELNLIWKHIIIHCGSFISKKNQSQRQQTYLLTCTPSKYSDQPAHSQSDQNLHGVHFGEHMGYFDKTCILINVDKLKNLVCYHLAVYNHDNKSKSIFSRRACLALYGMSF